MDNDFTVAAAYVTAFAAIIAPTITALIHSVKEYHVSKMTHTIECKLKSCEVFSNSYFKCQYGAEKTGYMDAFYVQTMKLIALCHRRSTKRSLFKLANHVKSHGASIESDRLYEKCIRRLSREI